MSEPLTIRDLRVYRRHCSDEVFPHCPGHDLDVLTPAEFDALARAWATERGWVEPKPCGECKGKWWCSEDGLPKDQPCVRDHEDVCVDCGPCPSCGGTGREELCLTHGAAIYDEGLCFAQMARLYHETGGTSSLSGLSWVNDQYGECRWACPPHDWQPSGIAHMLRCSKCDEPAMAEENATAALEGGTE